MLDCSSVGDARRSLAELLGLSEANLAAHIARIDIDWSHHSIPPENQVLIQLGIDPDMPPKPSAIRWFHATRALPRSEYEEGLLPTLKAMPMLWQALGTCAAGWLSPSEWDDYVDSFARNDRRFSRQFHQKRMAPDWEGPFAFLVRDAALHKHRGHKDFTMLCEAAEDICADFERVHGYALKAAYQSATRPCLVVFTWPGERYGTVRAAANYVCRTLQGIECGTDCNANFNGKGEVVPKALISTIEWL